MIKSLAVVLVLLTISAEARATSMVPMFLDDLTAASQTVAHGKVVASRAEWDEGHNTIYTIYTVQPLQYLKGQLGSVFELREPGGVVGDIGMNVAGAPQFRVGQDAVLFVWTDAKGKHQVSGFEQGVVLVETDPATGAKMASRAVPLGSAPANAEVSPSQPATSRALPQLFDQIRTSVARTSQRRASE